MRISDWSSDVCSSDLLELGEPALGLAVLGEVEEMRLGLLDLLGGRAVEVALEGFVDDGFADLDQLAAQEAVTDLAAVDLGVDDGDHRGGETDEVGRTTDLLERLVLVEDRKSTRLNSSH